MENTSPRMRFVSACLAIGLLFLTILPGAASADSNSVSEAYSAATDAYDRGDYELALEKYRQIAEKGDADSQYALGWMYQYGLGTSVDYDQALVWLQLAAEQGVDRAQYNLGYMYHHGWGGVQKDLDEAIKWYFLAAEQESEYALYEIGSLYFHGQGMPQNVETAIQYFERAAEKKYNRALETLGSIYFEGTGVKQDYVLAYTWWSAALTTEETQPNRQEEFIARLKASRAQVAALMSDSELAEAKQRAAEQIAK